MNISLIVSLAIILIIFEVFLGIIIFLKQDVKFLNKDVCRLIKENNELKNDVHKIKLELKYKNNNKD